MQADVDTIMAAPLVRNESKAGLEETNNLLLYGFFCICQEENIALAA